MHERSVMSTAPHPLQSDVLAQGALARVVRYEHTDAWAGDAPEEESGASAIVFTARAAWSYHGRGGLTEADPDTVVIFEAGERYRPLHPTDTPQDRNLAVELDDDQLRAAMAMHGDPVAQAIVDGRLPASGTLPRSPQLRAALARLLETVTRTPPNSESLEVDSRVIDLLLATTQAAAGRIVDPQVLGDPISRAITYLTENLHRPIRLDDIAAEANLSPFHFHRLFREQTGTTPHRYLMGLRVSAAIRMLTTTDLPVTAIAYRTGFASSSHLARSTRQRFGSTPTELRRQGPGRT